MSEVNDHLELGGPIGAKARAPRRAPTSACPARGRAERPGAGCDPWSDDPRQPRRP